jgi:hypothetical protein
MPCHPGRPAWSLWPDRATATGGGSNAARKRCRDAGAARAGDRDRDHRFDANSISYGNAGPNRDRGAYGDHHTDHDRDPWALCAIMDEWTCADAAFAARVDHLRGALAVLTEECTARGCLAVISSGACGAEGESVRAEVFARRSVWNAAIVERFERAQAEGDLPPSVDPRGLSRLLIAMLQGISIQHGDGATKAQLEQLIDTSLALWPSAK